MIVNFSRISIVYGHIHNLIPSVLEYGHINNLFSFSSYPKCVCRCVCIQQPVDDQHQTQLPRGHQHGGDDVPPDIVVSVIRSSSGFFQGTLSAVSTISGHIQPSMARIFTRGDQDQEPPPYEAPPSYRAATEKPCQCLARSVTV